MTGWQHVFWAESHLELMMNLLRRQMDSVPAV